MKKRKLIVGEVLPVKTGFGFSMDLEILFLDGLDIGRECKQIIRVNQLSETKIYAQAYVNKRITALFIAPYFYAHIRNNLFTYRKVARMITVNSAKQKW
jgi:hypothetical protein